LSHSSFAGDDRVSPSGFSDEELEAVTEDNFERLLDNAELSRLDAVGGVMGGVSIATTVRLWPFVIARLRDRISADQLQRACVRILGESGVRLVPKLIAAAAIGPLYLWYVLASGVMGIADAADDAAQRGAR
jgi:hypothetical protein